jgi:hypothetical protein
LKLKEPRSEHFHQEKTKEVPQSNLPVGYGHRGVTNEDHVNDMDVSDEEIFLSPYVSSKASPMTMPSALQKGGIDVVPESIEGVHAPTSAPLWREEMGVGPSDARNVSNLKYGYPDGINDPILDMTGFVPECPPRNNLILKKNSRTACVLLEALVICTYKCVVLGRRIPKTGGIVHTVQQLLLGFGEPVRNAVKTATGPGGNCPPFLDFGLALAGVRDYATMLFEKENEAKVHQLQAGQADQYISVSLGEALTCANIFRPASMLSVKRMEALTSPVP